jgi:hypothetical protein
MISIHQRHPLHRDGTNRVSRLLKALAPDYFKLDDRSMQDIMVAAHRYAQQLSYINEKNQPDGDWSAFWEVETLTYLAVLSALDTEELRRKYDDADYALATALENYNPAKGKPNPVPGLYRDLLNILFDMAKGIEEMYLKLVAIQHPMQSILLNLIKRDNQCDFEELDGALQKLVALHKGADDKLVHERYNLFYAPDDRWGIPNRKQYDLIKPDIKLNREKLRALFITFFNVYLLINHRGQMAFDAELALMEKPEQEAYRIVQPHVSLFIAFLRLFRHAQDSLNELTKKQLDYYYENILCLGRQAAKPDHVHLIFTLAKNFDQELIEKGTLLLGGKDKNGQPMYYETLQDWVVTQAQVAEVKTVFVAKRLSFDTDGLQNDQKFKSILASSFSTDGATPQRMFGDDRLAPEAEIGMAIHSPQLILEEGNRWIKVDISNMDSPLFGLTSGDHATDYLAVAVSTKKGWVYLDLPLLTGTTVPTVDHLKKKGFLDGNFNSFVTIFPLNSTSHLIQACCALKEDIVNKLIIEIFLPADFDALEPVEGESKSQYPGIKVVLKRNTLKYLNDPYSKMLTSAEHKITIGVRAEGVSKSLITQTDAGVFDGTQQIMPFGPTAPKGAKFYIGAKCFHTKLDKFNLRFDWVGTNGKSGNAFDIEPAILTTTQIEFLKDNQFSGDNIGITNGFFNGTNKINETVAINGINLKRSNDYPVIGKFDPSSRRGFLMCTFNGDMGHGSFTERLAKKSIQVSKMGIGVVLAQDLPNPPYTPTFNSIKLDYISTGQAMENGIDEFYYLHPYDGYEQRKFFIKDIHYSLFPDYKNYSLGGNQTVLTDGHLLIGFSQLKPESSISLLVQTSEGSERNADTDVPILHWGYLRKGNEWTSLSPLNILSDTTGKLTKSGIVQIEIPKDISSEGNTMLNPNLLWLRISAETDGSKSSAALPDLLHLRTQVIEAQLRIEDGLEPAHLADGQAASSISKLAISRSAVKKIEQPAPTYNGKEAETAGQVFYQRISEHLRHRNRAITAWDYENLLLHHFADVATAKCINHTQYKLTPSSELAPGFVTIAVIPDLRKRAGTSLERPRFPKGDLDDMRDFLNNRANLFLNETVGVGYKFLQVVNPQYEPLSIKIKVKISGGYDKAFYKEKLSDDLKNHIAPWVKNPENTPVFGRKLRKSGLIRFIEDLPYIDYIDVNDFSIKKDDIKLGEIIEPNTEHGILTTAAIHEVETL